MPYVLRFNPGGTSDGDVVTFTTAITNNAGTSAWTAEFRLKLISGYPTTGNWYILGSNATGVSGIALRQASGDGALAILTGGTFRVASSAGYILNDGAFHTYRIEHDAGGALRFYRDGDTTPYFSTTYTTSGSFNCNRFGAGSTTATVFTPMELEYFEYTGSTGGRRWDATLNTAGTGDVLPTTVGTNQGTLVNFPTDNSEWVFYGSGDQEVSLGTLSSTTVLYEPSVTKDKLVELPVIPGGSSLFEPTVIKDKLIEPSSITSGSSVFGPTVTKGSPSLNIGLNTIDSTVFFYDSTIKKDLRIQLLPMASTSIVYDLLLRKDLWVILGTLGSTSTVYTQEVIGGAIPLPSIELIPDEGYGLHIRTAKEMNDMILALAKRIQILEQQVL